MEGLVAFARDAPGIQFYPGQAALVEDWAKSGRRKAVPALGRRSGKGLRGLWSHPQRRGARLQRPPAASSYIIGSQRA